MSSAAQIEALEDGSIDVGLLRGIISDDRFSSEVVLEEPFVAVIWEGHPLSGEESIALAQLSDDAFILFPRSVAPAVHDDISAIFREAAVEPTIVMEAQEWLTIIGLVQSGIGVSIAPASFRRLQWGDVNYVALRDVSVKTSVSVCMPKRSVKPVSISCNR
jgi:DNA-binding transcriptional LysR family regulator